MSDTQQKPEDLAALLAQHQKVNQEQEVLLREQAAKIKDLEEENITLKASLAKATATGKKVETPKASAAIAEVNGKKYKVLRKAVHIPGIGKRNAEELIQDGDALNKVLSMEGQNILREIK